ncbi:hypothetical protein ACRAWD_23395 [Caulobacter segnis]
MQLTTGHAAFVIVGLADKAVAESRERVRGAFTAPSRAWACRCPASASSPTWARPTCPRKGRTSTCRSPWR